MPDFQLIWGCVVHACAASKTRRHMLAMMAATADESAPPLSGSRKPLAPERRR